MILSVSFQFTNLMAPLSALVHPIILVLIFVFCFGRWKVLCILREGGPCGVLGSGRSYGNLGWWVRCHHHNLWFALRKKIRNPTFMLARMCLDQSPKPLAFISGLNEGLTLYPTW